MTEKRYTIFGEWHKDCVIDEIRDNTGEYVTIGRVVDLLNENEQLKSKNRGLQSELQIFKEDVTHSNLQINKLADENEQLKQVNRNLGDFRNFITEKNVSNEKQRKELQLQMLRLYNYFENWFEDTMSPNAFSEMWDSVKEDEKWEKRWLND